MKTITEQYNEVVERAFQGEISFKDMTNLLHQLRFDARQSQKEEEFVDAAKLFSRNPKYTAFGNNLIKYFMSKEGCQDMAEYWKAHPEQLKGRKGYIPITFTEK